MNVIIHSKAPLNLFFFLKILLRNSYERHEKQPSAVNVFSERMQTCDYMMLVFQLRLRIEFLTILGTTRLPAYHNSSRQLLRSSFLFAQRFPLINSCMSRLTCLPPDVICTQCAHTTLRLPLHWLHGDWRVPIA